MSANRRSIFAALLAAGASAAALGSSSAAMKSTPGYGGAESSDAELNIDGGRP